MFYNGRRIKICLHIIFPISAPQIRRYQQEPVNGALQVIAWSPSFVSEGMQTILSIRYVTTIFNHTSPFVT